MITDLDKEWMRHVVVAGSHASKHNTFEIVERVLDDGVHGVFVEAGACGGGQIAVMSYALRKRGETREIHAFDSWEGIPKATDEDDPQTKAEYGTRQLDEPIVSSGKLVATEENFWRNLRAWGATTLVVARKGWLQETLPGWSLPIALLRIDVDLAASVRCALENLYPFVARGGFVIFDDWGLEDVPEPACRKALREFLSGVLPDVSMVEGNPGTVWWKKL